MFGPVFKGDPRSLDHLTQVDQLGIVVNAPTLLQPKRTGYDVKLDRWHDHWERLERLRPSGTEFHKAEPAFHIARGHQKDDEFWLLDLLFHIFVKVIPKRDVLTIDTRAEDRLGGNADRLFEEGDEFVGKRFVGHDVADEDVGHCCSPLVVRKVPVLASDVQASAFLPDFRGGALE